MTEAFGFLTSLLICFFAIPSIIRIAELKNLMDQPGVRKTHQNMIPTLGGVAIFAGLIFSLSFWVQDSAFGEMKYFIAGLIIIFFMGIKDDLYDLVHYKKMLTQILVALMLVHYGDVRLTSLYRIFGVQDIPLWSSYLITVFTIVVIVNAFNLIDGVDALAGSVASVICLFFGFWFSLVGYQAMSLMAFSLLGALFGFLYYNRTPAKIFMGDTGSLLIGLVISVLTIKFIEFNKVNGGPYQITAVPVVAIAILIVPLFDLARVFFIRIKNGKSPLSGDRNHLHHRLLDLGFKPMQVSGLLSLITAFYIASAVFFCRLQAELLLLILMSATALLIFWVEAKHKRLKRI
jgi:UDP-GlcNAc:undecaprenyl-phosphate GlcNAc-1-phosphate transferase